MEKISKRLPLILAAAGSLIYLTLIFNNNLWMDEAFTALLVKGSFKEMMQRSMADTLPPLYNIWAWAITHIFGYSTLTLKLSSVIPMTGLLFFAAFKVSDLYNKNTASFFILCLIAAPHMLLCAVEIRMYAMCLAFTTVAALYALSYIKLPSFKNGLFLVLFTLLAGYSHHYGLIALLFIWAFMLIYFFRKKDGLKLFLISALTAALLFIPYICLTLYQIKNASSYFSAVQPTFGTFLSSLRFPFVTGITPLSLLLLLAFLVSLIFGSRLKEGYALISVYILVLILSYLLMLISGRTFFSGRYLIPSFGMLYLGFSILLFGGPLHVREKAVRIFLLTYVILMTAVGIAGYTAACKEEYSGDTAQMIDFLEKNMSEDDGYIIYEDNYQIEWCLKYYAPYLHKCLPENADKVKGKLWYFEVEGYENLIDESPLKAYNRDYKGELSFDRYRFKVYEIDRR